MTLQEHYRTSVANALAGFQLIEESLKGYLDLYYQSIRHLLSKRLHFDYHRSDINEAALGRLIGAFAKSSANTELVTRLRSLVRQRDSAAHTALICLYDSSTTDEQYHTMIKANHALSDELREVLSALIDEVSSMQKATFGTP
jgi:uncharacterized protein YdiU (UPF0061 family)